MRSEISAHPPTQDAPTSGRHRRGCVPAPISWHTQTTRAAVQRTRGPTQTADPGAHVACMSLGRLEDLWNTAASLRHSEPVTNTNTMSCVHG